MPPKFFLVNLWTRWFQSFLAFCRVLCRLRWPFARSVWKVTLLVEEVVKLLCLHRVSKNCSKLFQWCFGNCKDIVKLLQDRVVVFCCYTRHAENHVLKLRGKKCKLNKSIRKIDTNFVICEVQGNYWNCLDARINMMRSIPVVYDYTDHPIPQFLHQPSSTGLLLSLAEPCLPVKVVKWTESSFFLSCILMRLHEFLDMPFEFSLSNLASIRNNKFSDYTILYLLPLVLQRSQQ